MYEPNKIRSEEQLTGFLRCSIQDIPTLINKEVGISKFRIPKKNRQYGYRIVYKVNSCLISNVLKCLKLELSKLYHPNGCVGGFVSGRNIAYNAKFHLNKNVVLNIDIKNFFESISYLNIVKTFENLGFIKNIAEILADIVTYKRVLVAGFNTSPLLANLVCIDLDNEILSLCQRHNVSYTRYADDLSFSGEKLDFFEEIVQIISKYGFSINEDKTRLYKRGRSQYVTGLTVADKTMPRIPRKIKKSLRADLYYIKIYGLISHIEYKYEVNLNNESLSDSACTKEAARIMGWIHYINGIEPIFAKKCCEEIAHAKYDKDQIYFEKADLYVNSRKY